MATMTKWLAACCLFALAPPAMAQENTPRPIPEGFVLPGPPPTNAPAGAIVPGVTPAPAGPQPAAPAPRGTPPAVSGSNVATQNTVLPTAGAVQILGAGTGGQHQWPCVQRKVDHVDAGQVWPGPPLDEAEKVPRTDAMRQFVANVAARRLPLPEAVRTAADFVKALPVDQRAQTATAAFADLLQQMNSERLQIMRGIERYGAHQQALADKLREENTSLSELRSRGDPKAAEAQEALLWDTRVFEERRRSLTYVCEVPTLIEQRLFALGRAMSGAL
jgi:hypothetical protein